MHSRSTKLSHAKDRNCVKLLPIFAKHKAAEGAPRALKDRTERAQRCVQAICAAARNKTIERDVTPGKGMKMQHTSQKTFTHENGFEILRLGNGQVFTNDLLWATGASMVPTKPTRARPTIPRPQPKCQMCVGSRTAWSSCQLAKARSSASSANCGSKPTVPIQPPSKLCIESGTSGFLTARHMSHTNLQENLTFAYKLSFHLCHAHQPSDFKTFRNELLHIHKWLSTAKMSKCQNYFQCQHAQSLKENAQKQKQTISIRRTPAGRSKGLHTG
jgi:hypothetical protein